MKLSELADDLIVITLTGKDSQSVLYEFADAICSAGKYSDSNLLYERLHEREKQECTGVGNGIAIPHCKIENLAHVILGVGYSDSGVDFGAIDGKPISYFFVVISPAGASVLHLRMLAALSRLLRSNNFVSQLQRKPGRDELIIMIRQEEQNTAVAS